MSGENVTIDEPARAGRSRFWGRWVDAIVVFMLAPLPLNLLVVSLARPGVLTRHPLLRAYCDFMARIVPSIPKWTAVSAFPQITALAFSIAWGCGIPLFFMMTVKFLRGYLHWEKTLRVYKDRVINRRTPTELVMAALGYPLFWVLVLGDMGVLHFLGIYRGVNIPLVIYRGAHIPWNLDEPVTHLVSTSKFWLIVVSWAMAGGVGFLYPGVVLTFPWFYKGVYDRLMG